MSILILTYFLLMSIIQVNGNPKVSAAYIFGDSTVDSGNNNWINTLTRANFPPYGRDFPGGKPTGRFTNGKLATDIASELLGLPDIIPAYLDPNFKGERLLTGACFASAASGFFYATPKETNALDMNKQLELFLQYKAKLINMVGFENATKIISGAIFLMSAGTVDFTNYYFINPFARIKYTINTFQDIMLETFANFTRAIYHGGARHFLVMGLPPIGCLPSQITLHNLFGNKCVTRMNQASMSMNWKLQVMRVRLMKELHGLNMVYLDSYNVILDILRKPSKYGFKHRRRGCCGTGLLEASFLCNKLSPTCRNVSEYVWWDSYHPTTKTYNILAQNFTAQITRLLANNS